MEPPHQLLGPLSIRDGRHASVKHDILVPHTRRCERNSVRIPKLIHGEPRCTRDGTACNSDLRFRDKKGFGCARIVSCCAPQIRDLMTGAENLQRIPDLILPAAYILKRTRTFDNFEERNQIVSQCKKVYPLHIALFFSLVLRNQHNDVRNPAFAKKTLGRGPHRSPGVGN